MAFVRIWREIVLSVIDLHLIPKLEGGGWTESTESSHISFTVKGKRVLGSTRLAIVLGFRAQCTWTQDQANERRQAKRKTIRINAALHGNHFFCLEVLSWRCAGAWRSWHLAALSQRHSATGRTRFVMVTLVHSPASVLVKPVHRYAASTTPTGDTGELLQVLLSGPDS